MTAPQSRIFLRINVALVMMFVLQPLLADSPFGFHFANTMLLAALISTVSTLAERTPVRAAYRFAGFAIFAALLAAERLQEPALLLMGVLAYLVFFVVVGAHILRAVASGWGHGLARIAAAVGVYLISAVVWGLAYTALDVALPESFAGEHLRNNGELMYFSLITLSTLGYGDVLPVGGVARNLAALEAIWGQLYLAILVAALVNGVRDRPARSESSDPAPKRDVPRKE